MRNYLPPITFFCVLLVSMLSCQNRLTETLPPSKSPEISVDEAKKWFTEYSKKVSSTKLSRTILWDHAKLESFPNGRPLVIAPIAYARHNFQRAIITDHQTNKFDNKNDEFDGLIRKLIIFKDVNDITQVYVLSVVPDETYKKTHKHKTEASDFTGVMFFKDWREEKFVEGWRLVNGHYSSLVSLSPLNTIQGARPADIQTCHVVTTGTLTCQASNARSYGDKRPCSFEASEVSTICWGGGHGVGSTGSMPSGQIGSAGGYYGSGTIPEGMSQNQYVNNFLAQYGSQLSSSEQMWIMDCDDWPLLRTVIRFIKELGAMAIEPIINLYQTFTGEAFTEAEKQILDNIDGSAFARMHYMVYVYNAYQSREIAKTIFKDGRANGLDAGDCAECVGNSFKHAIFINFNAYDYGAQLASQLANAHEGAATDIQSVMDRHNNGQGLEIFNEYKNITSQCFGENCLDYIVIPVWTKAINERIEAGNLKYIRKSVQFPDDPSKDEYVTTDTGGLSRR